MLKAWRTPFESEKFPSIWISSPGGSLETTMINVGWPAAWQITFETIIGLKVCDESYDNNQRFWIERDLDDLCSYTWENSSWLNEFNVFLTETIGESKVVHYVLLGGDYNVELLACGKVTIKSAINS